MVNPQNSKMLTLPYHKDRFQGHFFFLIYVNDLIQGLYSDVKLFADDTSLFSIINDIHASSATLNNDLDSFNPDRIKQAQEVILSRKIRKGFHRNLSILMISQLEDQWPINIKGYFWMKNYRLLIASTIKSIKP